MATGTLTVNLTGGLAGTKVVSAAYSFGAAVEATSQVLLGVNTTITIPTNANACLIAPPNTNLNTIGLKSVAGDAGIAISKTIPTWIVFDSPAPASFVLNAGGAVTVDISFV